MIDTVLAENPRGGSTVLTTASPRCDNGFPVLRIRTDGIPSDFKPADVIDGRGLAAAVVVSWAGKPQRTEREIEAARRFLAQWPEGPQIQNTR